MKKITSNLCNRLLLLMACLAAISVSAMAESAQEKYAKAYDNVVLQNVSPDSLSKLSGVDRKHFVEMRFGKTSLNENVAGFVVALSESIDKGEDFGSDDWKEKIGETTFKPLSTTMTFDQVKELQMKRNAMADEAAAIYAASIYSSVVDEYLNDKFGFFGSIWQGIRYMFTSKDSYTVGFEKDLIAAMSDDNLSAQMVAYFNGVKATIEFEQQTLLNLPPVANDFKEFTAIANHTKISAEVKEQLAKRGALEAADIAVSVGFDIVGWIVASLILSGICNILLNKARQDELDRAFLIGKFKPQNFWWKVAKGVAYGANAIFSARERQKIEAKYSRYKFWCNTAISVCSWVVAFVFFIQPQVKTDMEINKLLSVQFCEYFQGLQIPVSQIFESIICRN